MAVLAELGMHSGSRERSDVVVVLVKRSCCSVTGLAARMSCLTRGGITQSSDRRLVGCGCGGTTAGSSEDSKLSVVAGPGPRRNSSSRTLVLSDDPLSSNRHELLTGSAATAAGGADLL